MTRKQIQSVSYEAIARLVQAKMKYGFLPSSYGDYVLRKIDETKHLLHAIEQALEQDDRLTSDLRAVIKSYNEEILSYSSDQIIPVPRPFGGRWFDGFTIPASLIEVANFQS